MVGKIPPILPSTPILLPGGTFNPDAYNCHSYAWDNSQGDPTDPNYDPRIPKWDDDPLNNTRGYHPIPFSAPNQVGDRIIYYNVDQNGNLVPTHSAIVTQVDKDGFASQATSKWGQFGVYNHSPRDVPSTYGPDAPTMKVNGVVYATRVYYRKN